MGWDTDRDMSDLKTQKREILQEGVNAMLSKSSIPLRVHLQVIKALKGKIDDYSQELKKATEQRNRVANQSDSHLEQFDKFAEDMQQTISLMQAEIERLTTIDHLEGKAGKDAVPIDIQEIISGLIPHIPVAIPGEPGRAGQNASIDLEELTTEIVKEIRSKKLIEVTDIRNSESFLFNKKRYKFEELMRGAGGGTTSGGQSVTTQYLLTAVQAGLNVTIDLTQLSNWATFDSLIAMYRNNVPQTLGIDFSIVGSVVTINGADAGEVFNATYAYS